MAQGIGPSDNKESFGQQRRDKLKHTDSRSADKELQTGCLGNIIYACVSACLQLDELIERVLFLCNAPCSTVVKILLFNDWREKNLMVWTRFIRGCRVLHGRLAGYLLARTRMCTHMSIFALASVSTLACSIAFPECPRWCE